MGKLAELWKVATTREPVVEPLVLDRAPRTRPAVADSPASSKSLRDQQTIGGNSDLGVRAHVGVFSLNNKSTIEALRKQNVSMLRRYAEFSVWVRAAIKCYRDTVRRAKPVLRQIDPTRPMNEKARREITALLARPNRARIPYGTLKEQMVEDYLVLGHGALELLLRRDALPLGLRAFDAGKLAFTKGWDGSDPTLPRYAELDKSNRPRRFLADQQMMCLVNCPRTYDELGLSHVEVLDLAVRALLESDGQTLKQISKPMPSGALNLGMGATKPQIEQVRNEMQQVEHPFVVLGGTESMNFVRFDATAAQLRKLDQNEWFVRQVAAIFQVSTAKLRLAVDTSRANTEALFDDDLEGPGALLETIAELENVVIVEPWGDPESINIALDYPVMHRKSEREQADIGVQALGSQPWRTINEVRRATGDPELDTPLADEVLLKVGEQLIPLSVYQEQINERTKPPAPPRPEPPSDENKKDPKGGDDEEDDEEEGGDAQTSEKGLRSVKWTDAETQAAAAFSDGDAQRMFHYLASVSPHLAAMFTAEKTD